MLNARDLYTMDVPLFQPTNFSYSLQRVTENTEKGSGIKNEIKENQQLADELHKSIIRKFEKRKVFFF